MNPRMYSKELRGHWYLAVAKHGKPVKEVCELFGISRQTYYKWYRLDHGRTRNAYHPAKHQPNLKLTPPVRSLIDREKRLTNYGPLKMKLLLRRRLNLTVSTTVIYRFYLSRHLIRRPQKTIPWYEPLKEPVRPEKPGDVVQMDTKHVWLTGKRQYQRTLIDIYTGLQSAVVKDTLEAADTQAAFAAAEQFFPFPIQGVQTDNGSEYRGDFHVWLGRRGIAHYFIPKGSPQWNGAVERAHGVIDQEYYLNPSRPWKTLTEYLVWYNQERIHLGKYLNGRTPMEKLQAYRARSVRLAC